MRRTDAERPHAKPLDPVGFQGVPDGGRLLGLAEPSRPDQGDVRLRQSPEREPECVRGRGVEPLEIVDREHEPVVGQKLQRAPHRDAERPLVDGSSFCVLDEQRHLERSALGRRQRRQRVVEDAVEQVAEADVRKRTLRFGWPRREHARPTAARLLDGGVPERRLPDPGLAFERDRERAIPGRRAGRRTPTAR